MVCERALEPLTRLARRRTAEDETSSCTRHAAAMQTALSRVCAWQLGIAGLGRQRHAESGNAQHLLDLPHHVLGTREIARRGPLEFVPRSVLIGCGRCGNVRRYVLRLGVRDIH
jgi:hypothetical protein